MLDSMCQFVKQEEKFVASSISSEVSGLRDDKRDIFGSVTRRERIHQVTDTYIHIYIYKTMLIIVVTNILFFLHVLVQLNCA